MQIRNRYTNDLIFEDASTNPKDTLLAAIKARANLYGANLYGADLTGANLYGADLTGANLYGANLTRANLTRADLTRANLYGANLYGANLYGANLYGADLTRADLTRADLYGANLYGANLYGANLYGADLMEIKGTDKIPEIILARMRIVPSAGNFIGWKKLKDGTICQLLIPEDAKRMGGIVGRKCRASKAIVIDGEGVSSFDSDFKYTKGATVEPKQPFCENEFLECESGIHFYISREEAEAHS